jgi:hypothetical protein
VTTSLEAGELAVVMITCGGRNRGRMTHDGQRCERILRRPPPPCHWFSWAMLSNFPCGRDHCRDLGAPAAKRVCRGAALRKPAMALADREAFPCCRDHWVVPVGDEKLETCISPASAGGLFLRLG